MRIKLVSAGYVILQKGKKGIKFFPIKDGKIEYENPLYFSARGNYYPVGQVVSVNQINERSFRNWKLENDSCDIIPEESLERYKVESELNREECNIMMLQRRAARMEKDFGKMTIKEIKEFIRKHPHKRHEVVYYIMKRLY